MVIDRVLQFTYNNVKEVPHTRYLVSAHIHLFAFTLHFVSPLRQELPFFFFFSFAVMTASATTEFLSVQGFLTSNNVIIKILHNIVEYMYKSEPIMNREGQLIIRDTYS